MPPSSPPPDLVLFNARVVTLNPRWPTAEAIAVKGDRIAWVGTNEEWSRLTVGRPQSIDCGGRTLVPGFIDAHCHVLAYASSLLAVDCSPSAVSSITDIKAALRRRACNAAPSEWIRGSGYSEFDLGERRHPTRWDLDEAVPHHPVRLNHRSGHACVLNSAALSLSGISKDAAEPPEGVIERDPQDGEPTGLLLEMDAYLERFIPQLDEEELRRGVQLASQRMLTLGITSLQDATPYNSPRRWEALRWLKSEGCLRPRVTMMAGADYLQGFLDLGLGFRSGDDDLNLGAAKVMLTTTAGTLTPSAEELRHKVSRAREAGFQVAIHAVEAEAVDVAADVLAERGPRHTSAGARGRDRIEHCSECLPASLERLRGSGVVVVTNPGFLYYSGRRYLSEVSEEMQPWLYRLASFQEAGLKPAAGSDAPVTDPNPLVGMYAAVTRRAEAGERLGEGERVSAEDALRMYTINGAYASFQEADKGSIEVGKLADLALLDLDPTQGEVERIREVNVTITLVGGKVVWEG